MKYISIPVEIDAVQFSIATLSELVIFSGCDNFQLSSKDGVYQCLLTVNNGQKLLVVTDDYVIKDTNGRISVMKPDVFNQSYIAKE